MAVNTTLRVWKPSAPAVITRRRHDNKGYGMIPDFTPYQYRARVDRVVDGDTVVCEIDLGFHITAKHSIRLADIDAPELFSGPPEERQAGLSSKVALQGIIDLSVMRQQREWPFVLVTQKDRQSFGRFVGTLWEADKLEVHESTESIGAQMVEGGHATWRE